MGGGNEGPPLVVAAETTPAPPNGGVLASAATTPPNASAGGPERTSTASAAAVMGDVASIDEGWELVERSSVPPSVEDMSASQLERLLLADVDAADAQEEKPAAADEEKGGEEVGKGALHSDRLLEESGAAVPAEPATTTETTTAETNKAPRTQAVPAPGAALLAATPNPPPASERSGPRRRLGRRTSGPGCTQGSRAVPEAPLRTARWYMVQVIVVIVVTSFVYHSFFTLPPSTPQAKASAGPVPRGAPSVASNSTRVRHAPAAHGQHRPKHIPAPTLEDGEAPASTQLKSATTAETQTEPDSTAHTQAQEAKDEKKLDQQERKRRKQEEKQQKQQEQQERKRRKQEEKQQKQQERKQREKEDKAARKRLKKERKQQQQEGADKSRQDEPRTLVNMVKSGAERMKQTVQKAMGEKAETLQRGWERTKTSAKEMLKNTSDKLSTTIHDLVDDTFPRPAPAEREQQEKKHARHGKGRKGQHRRNKHH